MACGRTERRIHRIFNPRAVDLRQTAPGRRGTVDPIEQLQDAIEVIAAALDRLTPEPSEQPTEGA